jgi:hypothetical protein
MRERCQAVHRSSAAGRRYAAGETMAVLACTTALRGKAMPQCGRVELNQMSSGTGATPQMAQKSGKAMTQPRSFPVRLGLFI